MSRARCMCKCKLAASLRAERPGHWRGAGGHYDREIERRVRRACRLGACAPLRSRRSTTTTVPESQSTSDCASGDRGNGMSIAAISGMRARAGRHEHARLHSILAVDLHHRLLQRLRIVGVCTASSGHLAAHLLLIERRLGRSHRQQPLVERLPAAACDRAHEPLPGSRLAAAARVDESQPQQARAQAASLAPPQRCGEREHLQSKFDRPRLQRLGEALPVELSPGSHRLGGRIVENRVERPVGLAAALCEQAVCEHARSDRERQRAQRRHRVDRGGGQSQLQRGRAQLAPARRSSQARDRHHRTQSAGRRARPGGQPSP